MDSPANDNLKANLHTQDVLSPEKSSSDRPQEVESNSKGKEIYPSLPESLSNQSTTTTSVNSTSEETQAPPSSQTPPNPTSAPAPDASNTNTGAAGVNQDESAATGAFECNICLDTATDAVISLCGHLYCWPCLHQWLEMHGEAAVCPVCKAGIGKDKVIPLYGRSADGKHSTSDPREKPPPPRPQGQRPEPGRASSSQRHGVGGMQGGVHFGPFFGPFGGPAGMGGMGLTFGGGMGLFPSLFGFSLSFPMGGGQAPANGPGGPPQGAGMDDQQHQQQQQPRRLTEEEEQQAFLSRIFFMLGLLVITSLLMY